MNGGKIWWGQIGNSLRLLETVTNCLRDGCSAVLRLPVRLPWRQEFRDSVALRRTALGNNRSMKTLSWHQGAEPGDLILQELCSRQVRAGYWPGMSCAEYLGGLTELPMNQQDIWITGIHEREDLLKWAAFLSTYDRVCGELPSRAVFLLEYDGPAAAIAGITQLQGTVEEYDCRVFCLESGAALNNAGLREYQAELALRIGGGDPELSWALLRTGEDLILDPVRTTLGAVARERDSAGRQFCPLSEQEILSAAWRAALVIFFPIMEQWRMDFVSRHDAELRKYLPISNSSGEKVTDPYDLEIGALYFISNKPGVSFSDEEKAKIDLCRDTRNRLAHIKIPDRNSAQQIMQL